MHKRSCFWKPFGNEDVKNSLKLPKSAWKYFYRTFSSFWGNVSLKKSFLFRSEILGLLVKTLTTNYEYSGSNTGNLPLPAQMQLSEKLKTFSLFFYCTFWICVKFWTFWKINEPHSSSISEVIDSQRRIYINA